jgi:hypothetical protein
MSSASGNLTYTQMLESCHSKKQQLIRNSRYFSVGRFSSFFLIISFVITAISLDELWWAPVLMMLTIFILLVILHEKLGRKQKFNEACIKALEHELEAAKGQYTSFDGGVEFDNPAHQYSTDLDIFGDHSVFQALNRTATISGKQMLANWLREPLMNKLEIIARQGAVKELAGLPEWRIHLQAHGMVAQEEKKDLENLLEWLSVKPMFNAGFFKVARILIPLASFIMVTILATDFISMQLFLIYLILPLSITGYYTKRINHRHMMLSKKVELLSLYAIRFRMIESGVFTSEFMKGLSGKLKSGNQLASSVIKHLGRITSSLDTRLNLLAGFILNIFLLWDVRQMMLLEQWQVMHKQNLPIWFEALSQTEAIASMSGFSAANPGFVFPEIGTDIFQIKANEAGHPLIPKEQRIDNDIQLTNKGHFNIVTGANMAGKSTYLRTIGVNMVLALSGAPVCAKAFICYPAPVFTSLRTTDSLSTNQSYFYAELMKLKELIDRLGRGEQLFILLDEILKGTNSVDKQAGSKALLSQLIGLKAAGFIATHDLELGSLEKTFPDEVINYHFEAEIAGDELHFDYKLKPGIARNMNATFLMQRMGITI